MHVCRSMMRKEPPKIKHQYIVDDSIMNIIMLNYVQFWLYKIIF